MIGKALKNVSSAVTRAAQSAPKPAPKPAYKLPPVRLPAVRSPAPPLKKGGPVSSKRAVKVKPKGRKS